MKELKNEVYEERPSDTRLWPLHLKDTTPLDIDAVRTLPTTRAQTREFLESALPFIGIGEGNPFPLPHVLQTSRTIKTTRLTPEDLNRAVAMGKFELCRNEHGEPLTHIRNGILPPDYNGVNVFTVPEMKGRRRLITEPHLNAIIDKDRLPKVTYPTRLGRRQSLRDAKYMLQIDFEAYYDSIPLPESQRNKYVFRTGGKYYRLRTLPTGARWSVALGQAVTWVIVDIDTPVIIHTLIDNILVAAHAGQEEAFLKAVREILVRIRIANLLTSPDREELLSSSDEALLRLAQEDNVFLGEEYHWNGTERVVRNSTKTIAKLILSTQVPDRQFTRRSFVSAVSLVCYAVHTTKINPARLFRLLRAYRRVYRDVAAAGNEWDVPLLNLRQRVRDSLAEIGQTLAKNEWWEIDAVRAPTYDDGTYDLVIFTDASRQGWGAIVQDQRTGAITTYQQRFVDQRGPTQIPYRGQIAAKEGDNGVSNEEDDTDTSSDDDEEDDAEPADHVPPNTGQRQQSDGYAPAGAATRDMHKMSAAIPVRNKYGFFYARFSAHAEPKAAQSILALLRKEGTLKDGMRVALVTDHYAIAHAQKRTNGFGGIGRGYTLNRLFESTYDLWYDHRVDTVFFYVKGTSNPADYLSRHFGVQQQNTAAGGYDPVQVVRTAVTPQDLLDKTSGRGLPHLSETMCPIAEDLHFSNDGR